MAIGFGIDVGSSFIKGAVLHLDSGEIRSVERIPFPPFLAGLPPLHREVHPGDVSASLEALLLRLASVEPRFECVAFCGQMHGFVLVNDNGEAVSNYISWLDQRVSPAEFEAIAEDIDGRELREIGNEFRPGIAVPILASMRRNNTLPAGEITPVSIADFAAARLCQALPCMEPTQAAAFGGLRLGTLDWHDGVIGGLGLGSIRWPKVRPTGSTVGEWHGRPVYCAVGDQQCALAGALLQPGELSVNIGTGSQVAAIVASHDTSSLQTRPYFDGRFLRTITHIPGGRALAALVRLFTEIGAPSEDDVWNHIVRAVAAVPATDLRANIAFFPGPCGDRGSLENLHEANLTIGNVFRAVFESMARNHAHCARRLDFEKRFERIVFSGGVARKLPLVRELTAAALDLPHRLAPHAEETMYGLLVLARAFRSGSTLS